MYFPIFKNKSNCRRKLFHSSYCRMIIVFGIFTHFSKAKSTSQSSFPNIVVFLNFVTEMRKFFLSGLINSFTGSCSDSRLIIVPWVFLSARPGSARNGVSAKLYFILNVVPYLIMHFSIGNSRKDSH